MSILCLQQDWLLENGGSFHFSGAYDKDNTDTPITLFLREPHPGVKSRYSLMARGAYIDYFSLPTQSKTRKRSFVEYVNLDLLKSSQLLIQNVVTYL